MRSIAPPPPSSPPPFARFDADPDVSVAVLTGAGGTFCAGADLKAISQGRGNRVTVDGDGPMGPTRMMLDKPVIAAIEGHAVAGGLELAAVVRPARRRTGRGARACTAGVGACRWSTGAASAFPG